MNEIIAQFGETVTLTSYPPGGAYVNGRWVPPGSAVTAQITAAILPLGLSDMATEVAAAGLETKDSIAIYTETEIKESDEENAQDRDVITWNGNDYVIKMVVPRFQIPELGHYKAIGILKDS
jgi:hypothetical protein